MAPRNLRIFIIFFLFVIFFTKPRPCICHVLCHSHESEALLSFKAALNDSDGYLSSWRNGSDCCTWESISCDIHTNHVVRLGISTLDEHFEGLRYPYDGFAGVISDSLCNLSFLTDLGISGVKGTAPLPPCLGNLSHLQSLELGISGLSGIIPSSLCRLTSLTSLYLGWNELKGSIPSCLANLTSLTSLDLSNNQLSGNIPASLGSLYSLKELILDSNELTGNIPVSLGNLSLLTRLHLSANQLYGTIPSSFAQLSSLTEFDADGNAFNESISSPPFPSSIQYLSFSLNHHQSISETFFHNLTNIVSLSLSNCVLNISTAWIPSFQLGILELVSCKMDGQIPPWISTQFSLNTLSLANNSLFGEIPSWLWHASPQLSYVNLSTNHLQGNLGANASAWTQLDGLDVSRNALSGHMPSIWSPVLDYLLLNDNLFSGNIPPGLGRLDSLTLLNLANNNLSGVIPASLSYCSYLHVLNLGNNSLEGSLPHEFSMLSFLSSLRVHSNKLTGPFPPSIANCSNLQVLDIGHNSFQGEIPASVGNLSHLSVLVMKENNFTGTIPQEIGQLMDLQILLLSSNHISGFIPRSILCLRAMTVASENGIVLSQPIRDSWFQDGLDETSKGIHLQYPYILSTLTSIDLSNNELEGEVPYDFGILKGLRQLNLSMNNFNGTIPKSLGKMSQLESLDLSKNRFSGKIPDELKSIDSLGFLDLSNNDLSGKIPQGGHADTFEERSYSGNPNLWGCPLSKKCSWPKSAPAPDSINKEKESIDYPWYEIGVGLSYGVGFGVTIALIVLNMSWKKKYFKKVDDILKFLFPWLENWTF